MVAFFFLRYGFGGISGDIVFSICWGVVRRIKGLVLVRSREIVFLNVVYFGMLKWRSLGDLYVIVLR